MQTPDSPAKTTKRRHSAAFKLKLVGLCGNYRILTMMAAELLSSAAQKDLPVLDEKLCLDVFVPPAKATQRRLNAGRP